MNKNNIIDLLQKELEEMTTIFQNMRESASVPSVLFQLSNSKIENIKNLLEILQVEDGVSVEAEKSGACGETMPVQSETQSVKAEEPQSVVEEKTIETPAPVKAAKESKKAISDTIAEKKSLNEMMSENGKNRFDSTLANKKIQNLRQAINVVDRFRYQKELFGGDSEAMNKALDCINESPSWERASEIIDGFGWDASLPIVGEFMELVKRKFN
jgi:hypothetical protein